MAFRGVMKNGKIELENGATLPDGTVVLVEPVNDFAKAWEALAQDVSRAWKSPKSAVDLLIDSRR